jgi:hypothetical protein
MSPTGVYERKRRPSIDRFMEKVKIVRTPWQWTFCWVWTGHKEKKAGYGKFWFDGKCVYAHVFSFEHFVGPVPEGKQLDHYRCWNTSCVRPSHLRPATPLENTRNGKTHNAVKTHCIHGHEFTSENTRLFVDADGYLGRDCRVCKRERERTRYAMLKRIAAAASEFDTETS